MTIEQGAAPIDLPAGGHEVRKLGDEVARRIQADVIAAGWPVGQVLGSEPELLRRYGVGRAILREAVRVVEHLGVAQMRRGAGGGLVVTRPDHSAVLNSVLVYLTYEQARLEHLIDVRTPVEEAVARLAARRRTPDGMARVDAAVAAQTETFVDELGLHRAIAALTGNPVFELFVEILALLSVRYQAPTRLSAVRQRTAVIEAMSIHQRIAEAIADGDEDAAARRVVRHLESGRQYFTSRQLDRTLRFADSVETRHDGARLATVVAQRIYGEIVARGWPVGELLGSEATLIAQHDVSRAVLREAIRLLEFNGIVRTRRGVGGGTFIGAPSQTATVESMALYLEYRGITMEQLFEVRQAVELASIDRAVAGIDERGMTQLRAALVREREATELRELGHELHVHIAEVTGNPVLSLLLNALTKLSAQHTPPYSPEYGMTREEAASAMHYAHERIVEAIAAGELAAAKRRMERHLAALMPMQR